MGFDTIAVFRIVDRVSARLLFVTLCKIHVHATDAGEKGLLVVVGPHLHPLREQLDAALEQAERTSVFAAKALDDGQRAVHSVLGFDAELVDQHRQEVASFHLAPFAEPLQQIPDLRHDGRRVRVTVRVDRHHDFDTKHRFSDNRTANTNVKIIVSV